MGANGNLFPGGFTLNAGTVIVSGNNSFGGGVLTINGGTIQSSGARTFAPSSIVVGGDFAITGTGGWTMNMGVNLGGGTREINMTATGTKTWNGIVSNGGLTLSGTGTHVFTNASNSFAGPLSVLGGEVEFTTAGSLGLGTSITVDGGRIAMRNTYTVASSKNFFIGSNAEISTPGGSTVISYDGVIADSGMSTGNWAKQGGGVLELGGVSTYSGSTAINNGTVRLMTGSDRLPTGTTVSLGQSASANLGTLDLNGNGQAIAGLNSVTGTSVSANSNTVNSATSATLTLNGSGNYSYGSSTTQNSGVITGAVSVAKTGNGTQTLGGVNDYTGDTTVSGGRLIVSTTGAINSGGSAQFLVNGGVAQIDGSLNLGDVLVTAGTLEGIGEITSEVSVGANGQISPGSSIGTMDIVGNLNLAGTFNWEVESGSSNADILVVDGDVDLTGATLNLIQTGVYAQGETFTVMAYSGNLIGSFVNSLGGAWSINYDVNVEGANGTGGGGPSYITVTAIPEPSAMLMVGAAMILGGYRVRRRTK
jgi:autotransporter-associated beta strand protein